MCNFARHKNIHKKLIIEMKRLHNLLTLAALACLAVGMSACNDENEDNDGLDLVYNFGLNTTDYNGQGYWADVLNPEAGPVKYTGVTASHNVSSYTYDGTTTYSWTGFCPSKVSDVNDYTAEGTWVDHQFAAMPGKGYTTPNYLVGYWDSGETLDKNVQNPSCRIKFDSEVNVVSVNVANTTWGYYAMKNGSAFSKVFDGGDYCYVYIYGRINGITTNSIRVSLAEGGDIEDGWCGVDLTGLGKVDELVFQMESSDVSTYGGVSYMNNPSYFCLTDLYVHFDKSPIAQ